MSWVRGAAWGGAGDAELEKKKLGGGVGKGERVVQMHHDPHIGLGGKNKASIGGQKQPRFLWPGPAREKENLHISEWIKGRFSNKTHKKKPKKKKKKKRGGGETDYIIAQVSKGEMITEEKHVNYFTPGGETP